MVVLGGCDVKRIRRVPVLQGESWSICPMPDLGELSAPEGRRANVVDHGFIQATNGKWQLWACIRGTGVSRLLYGWEGDSLEEGPWRERGVMARADASFGESVNGTVEGIGAPFFFKEGDTFYCFYHSGGNGIRMMTSRDGVNYERTAKANGDYELYPNGGRDVMVLKVDDEFFFYSTVSVAAAPNHSFSFVNLRTTTDFENFSDYTNVSQGGRGGSGAVSAESPFVVHLDGYFYLFRASSMDFQTYVYRSETPYCFGCNDDSKLVAVLDIKAPELVHHEGQWYISDLADFQGLRLYRMTWEEDA